MSEPSNTDTYLWHIMKQFHSTQLQVASEFGFTEKEIIPCLRFHFYRYQQLYYKNAGELIHELCEFYEDETRIDKYDVKLTVTDEELCNRLKTLVIEKAENEKHEENEFDNKASVNERLDISSSPSMSKEQESLLSETRRLYMKTLCLSCLKDNSNVSPNARNVITLPCMHYSMCAKCARKSNQICVLCGKYISDYIHVYD